MFRRFEDWIVAIGVKFRAQDFRIKDFACPKVTECLADEEVLDDARGGRSAKNAPHDPLP